MPSFEQQPSTEPKKENGLKEKARKLATGAAIVAASFFSTESRGQSLKENMAVTPTTAWEFTPDSAEAHNNSARYPGVKEYYVHDVHNNMKQGAGAYVFRGYEDDQGNEWETPEELQEKILKAEIDSAQYDSAVFVEKGLAHESSETFAQDTYKAIIAAIDTDIQNERSSITVLKNNAGAELLKEHEEKLAALENKLQVYKNDTALMDRKIKEKRIGRAGWIFKAEKQMQDMNQALAELRQKKQEAEEYISKHSTKK